MRLTPGSKLRPYEILCPLRAGGVGEVYSSRLEGTTRMMRE
jgi:hypothetical protein